MPFGMENPIKIGTLSKSGVISFDFPEALPTISAEEKESESSKLGYTLFSQCNHGNVIMAMKWLQKRILFFLLIRVHYHCGLMINVMLVLFLRFQMKI